MIKERAVQNLYKKSLARLGPPLGGNKKYFRRIPKSRHRAVSTIFTALVTAVITVALNAFVQSYTMSKYEENNLIQSLVPALTSTDPRQIDLALSLLNESLNHTKFMKIKSIIDKKVQSVIEDAVSAEVKANPVLGKNSPEKTIESFSTANSNWGNMAVNSYKNKVKAITPQQFAKELSSLRTGYINDSYLDEILEIAAEAFKNKDYVDAYIAAHWVGKQTVNKGSFKNLDGIISIAPKDQARKIVKYKNGYHSNLDLMYSMRMLIPFFSPDPKTQGEEKDRKNEMFLMDLRRRDGFKKFFEPPKAESSKYEKIIEE